jgi:uncharacterized protein (DUF362 family)
MVVVIARSLSEALSAACFKDFIKDSSIVYLKPNLCTMAGPPATTPVDLVSEIVKFLLNNEITPKIVESDQATTTADVRAKFLGYLDLDIEFINLSRQESESIELSDGKKINLPKFLLSEDIRLINLPLIKATDVGFFTCCIKNLFGLLQTPYKGKLHKLLPEVLKTLYTIFNSKTFSIVYGGVAMEGKGSPVKGKPVKFEDFYIEGDDMMEMDVLIAKKVCGFDVNEIPYLEERSVEVVNENVLEEISLKYPKFGKMRPCELSFFKRGYYFIWEHMDSPLLVPLRKMLTRKYKKKL